MCARGGAAHVHAAWGNGRRDREYFVARGAHGIGGGVGPLRGVEGGGGQLYDRVGTGGRDSRHPSERGRSGIGRDWSTRRERRARPDTAVDGDDPNWKSRAAARSG